MTGCTNCKHPRSEHTGRSLTPPGDPRAPGTRLGPPDATPGGACEHLFDYHHTCSCPRYREPLLADPAVAQAAQTVRLAVARWHDVAKHRGTFQACTERTCYHAHPLVIR